MVSFADSLSGMLSIRACARCKYGKRIGISGRGRKVPTFFVAADSSIPLPVPCGNPALALGREDSENGCGGEAMPTQVKVRLTLADTSRTN